MISFHFDPVVPRQEVYLHAWDISGQEWNPRGNRQGDGTFLFTFDTGNSDLSQLRFMFRFPLDGNVWEPDQMIRHLPPSANGEWWCFASSPRCVTEDISTGPPIDQVKVEARTTRYKGGKLYVWGRSLDGKVEMSKEFDDISGVSQSDALFLVTLEDWMRKGFHYKLRKDKEWEPDEANRVWRPGDGDHVWIKSCQNMVRRAPLQLVTVDVTLLAAKFDESGALRSPQLKVSDITDEFAPLFVPTDSENLDSRIMKSGCFRDQSTQDTIKLYQDGIYWIKTQCEREGRILYAGTDQQIVLIEGDRRIFQQVPSRNVPVDLVVHPNPGTTFSDTIHLRVGIGDQVYETVEARRSEGCWRSAVMAFPGVASWFDIAASAGKKESRPDGDFCTRRIFEVSSPTTFHTIDGIAGHCSEVGLFEDIDLLERKAALKGAFTPAIVEAGVFDQWELPHGATVIGDEVWFVVKAPHAARSRLLLLDEGAGTRSIAKEMKLTNDLRYWWCTVPKSKAPHGSCYRFMLNDNQEVLDPAARMTNGTDRLWAEPNQKNEGPWARVVDRNKVVEAFQGAQWNTMGWEALIIYEMHALRFSFRNQTLQAFDRVRAELQPGGYLEKLGVTALEFLPINEYPKQAGWGYDPTLYFAIESSYGGPEKLASLVRAAHDNGKGVLLDVVYNHTGGESPLQAVAGDMYFDGETSWGAMVNYDHPAAKEFFRQALISLWDTFQLDGFRFDCTKAMIRGNEQTDVIKIVGSGGGWELLRWLKDNLRQAAKAKSLQYPYTVAENDPIDLAITKSGILDGQWQFAHYYKLGEAACGKDVTGEIAQQMDIPYNELRPFYEAVCYVCSHDGVSQQENWKKRVAARAPYDTGPMMAKAMAAATVLAKGIPMLFMGQEVAECEPFHFGMDCLDVKSRYLRLDDYESSYDDQKVRSWFCNMFGLRKSSRGIQGDDDQRVGRGYKTIAFTRDWGRIFVIATFGTTDTVQNLGYLGLPGGCAYKEIFNSSWPVFNVKCEPEHTNGSYWARLYSSDNVNLPPTGAVILERA